MTISSTINRTSTDGDGSAVNFSFPYLFFNQDDLTVILVDETTSVETTQVITTHYTVTGAGVAAGGTVIMGTAPTTSQKLVIQREEQYTQTLDLVENDPFPSDLVEQQLDTLTMLTQQLKTLSDRSIKLSDGDFSGADPTLATPVADSFLKWDAAGTALTSSSTSAGQSLGGNGTVLLPYYSYSSDPNSGQFLVGADQLGWSVNGIKGLDLSTSGLTVTGTLAATAITGSGVLSIDDTTETTSGTSGSIYTDGGLGVAKKLHVIGTATHGGDVLSDTDSTDSLGSTGVRWLKLWVDSIQTTGNTDISGNLTVTGNLTINGTTVTNDATNTEIKDPLIEINSGASSNANDLGLLMERGSTGDNVFMGWDESGDYFAFGTTTATGSSTGNISYSFGEIRASGAVFSGTSSNLGTVTTVDINGGTVDGAVIGGASAAAITGTTLTANTSITLATGGAMTGVLDSDAMSGTSAALLSTSESIKAYVDSSSKAAGISMTWETTTTDTDQGVGKVWANNATLSSATVLYFDDVERNSVSINALIDTLDDPTATNSATIYIQEAGTATAGVVFKCSGAVTSASTYSKVAVTHQATFGTLTDGDVVGVTFAFSGNDGSGSGTVTQINAGSGFSFSAITTTGTIAVDGNLEDLDALGAVSSNSEMIVGTGSGAYAYESGSTLRTSIGVSIGSDVQAFDSDTAKLDVDQTWAGAQRATVTAITSSSNSIAITLGASNDYSHTFTENTTLANPGDTAVAGQSGSLFLTQAAGANYTLAFGSEYDFAAGSAPTVTATNAARDRLDYVVRADGKIEITSLLNLS